MSEGKRAHAGWNEDERQLLWQEIEQNQQEGLPLRAAFDRIADQTGRKPNSVRNYYYATLKEKAEAEGVAQERALAFVPFTDEEVRELMWAIFEARANGQSVRACVQELARGDRTLMLRYQNKYRSMLKSHSDWVKNLMAEMRDAGIPVIDPYASLRMLRAVPNREAEKKAEAEREDKGGADMLFASLLTDLRSIGTQDVVYLLTGLRSLARLAASGLDRNRWMEESDRLAVRCDLLRLELARKDEEILLLKQSTGKPIHCALQMLEVNRNFLGMPQKQRELALAEYAEELSVSVSDMENALFLQS